MKDARNEQKSPAAWR